MCRRICEYISLELFDLDRQRDRQTDRQTECSASQIVVTISNIHPSGPRNREVAGAGGLSRPLFMYNRQFLIPPGRFRNRELSLR